MLKKYQLFTQHRRIICINILIILLCSFWGCNKLFETVESGIDTMGDALEGDPNFTGLEFISQDGKSIPGDIDISDLLKVWAAVPKIDSPPDTQSESEAVPRIIHEFRRAGKLTALSSCRTEIWFGFSHDIPALGKMSGGWHILRIAAPVGKVDKDSVAKLKGNGKIDGGSISECVIYHYEYRARDKEAIPLYEFAKKLVNGEQIPDDDPIVKHLYKFRGGGAYPLIFTTGKSIVLIQRDSVISEKKLKGINRKKVPLFLRQRGNRIFGIQRTKTGNTKLPFEHITGVYYEFYRVR